MVSVILYTELTVTAGSRICRPSEYRGRLPPLTKAIEQFLHFLEVEKAASGNTLAAYRNDLQQLADYLSRGLPRQVGIQWEAVERPKVEAYMLDLRRRDYRDSSVARKVAAARSFFAFLVWEGIISADLGGGLSPPRVAKIPPRTISPEELDQLLEQPAGRGTPEGKRDRAMLELLSATGIRVSELVSLDVADVHLDHLPVVYCPVGDAKRRTIPIHDAAPEALRLYLDEARPLLARARKGGALFVNQRGERLTRQGVWLILRGYAEASGLEGRISPRTLRCSFAARMLRGGTPLSVVQKMLGHTHVSTTRVYLSSVDG